MSADAFYQTRREILAILKRSPGTSDDELRNITRLLSIMSDAYEDHVAEADQRWKYERQFLEQRIDNLERRNNC